MSRFSGRGSKLPVVDEEETITVAVRATLTLTMWAESTQELKSIQVLVTDAQTEDGADVLTGVDGVMGTPIEVRVTRL